MSTSSDASPEIIECSICYEEFCNKNVSITPCGHKFCFSCIIRAVSYNKECPICRSRIAEESDPETEDDDDEETLYDTEDNENGDEESDDDDSDDDDDDEPEPDITVITERLEKNGFQLVDLVSLLQGTFSHSSGRTHEQYMEMVRKYDNIVDEVYCENRENYLFGKEDLPV